MFAHAPATNLLQVVSGLPSDMSGLIDDWERVENLPRDLVADVLAEALGPDHDGDVDQAADDEDPVVEEEELAGEEEALDLLQHGGGAEPPAAQVTFEQFRAAAEVTESGYVSCALPPYNAKLLGGRITTWPAHEPMFRRSVGMVCYYHSNCRSPARYRSQVSDACLMDWLYSATIEVDATTARKRELARAHKAMFADVEARHRV